MAGEWFKAAINEAAFALRRRKEPASGESNFVEPPLDAEALPAFARAMLASERAAQLKEKYRLQPLEKEALYLGTLFLIDLFDQLFIEQADYFSGWNRAPLRVLDVGARDFEAAPAIYLALRALGLEPQLTGVELEGAAAGAARAAMLDRWSSGQHRYLAGDIFDHRETYDLIVWLHPFLDREKLLEWGLPLRFLRPAEMLSHVDSLLAPGGVLVVVNQDAGENAAQRALFETFGRPYTSLEVPLYFRARDEPAYVHLLRSPVL